MHTLRNFSVVKGEEKRSTGHTHRAGRSRRAISPVIATIILIAITIVIAVAVAGWVFGLFGSYSRTNAVTIVAAASSCSSSNGCSIAVSNQGGSGVTVISYSVNGGSATTLNPAVVVPAGSTDVVTFSLTGITAGQTVDIQLGLSNGNTLTTTLVVNS